MTMSRLSPEVRERAVRLVREHRAEYTTSWAAITSIPDSSNVGKEVDLVTGSTTERVYAGVDHPNMSVTRDTVGTVLVSRTYSLDGLLVRSTIRSQVSRRPQHQGGRSDTDPHHR